MTSNLLCELKFTYIRNPFKSLFTPSLISSRKEGLLKLSTSPNYKGISPQFLVSYLWYFVSVKELNGKCEAMSSV
jgi:hypothetical protein